MSLELKVRQRARRDIVDHYDYIQADSLDAAERFLKNVDLALPNLLMFPDMGHARMSSRRELGLIRFIPVKDFEKYLIFYKAYPAKISILRVLHASRNIKAILGL